MARDLVPGVVLHVSYRKESIVVASERRIDQQKVRVALAAFSIWIPIDETEKVGIEQAAALNTLK